MKLKLSKKQLLWGGGVLLLLLLGGIAASLIARGPANASGQENATGNDSPDRIYKIKRGDMIIGVMLTGSVNAKTKHKLAMEAPFGTKLIRVVDENKKVNKGERVAEYETYDLLLKIEDLKVSLDNKKKDLEIALEEMAILKSSNEADIRTALDNVTDAENAYSKYWRLEGPRDRDDQNLKVDEAEKTYKDAKDAVLTLKETFNTTVYSDSTAENKAKQEIETAEQKQKSAETKYNSAILERKIFKRYTYPNKLKDLQNKLAQSRLNLNKTKVKTAASLVQKKNQLHQYETQIQKLDRELKKHLSYVPMMQLSSPVSGIVTYGDPDRRWGNPEVKVGMDARRKQVIITIPDMSQMIVDVNLPEQYRSKVTVGDRVIITPDSIQTIKINGKIASIASLPVNLIPWDQNSPKIYRTVVELFRNDKRIVSGMSVQVEVVSRILRNVLYIPIEAVFEEGGKLFVYRKTLSGPQKALIKINETNDNFVEITDGLDEGDEIYLYRPYQTGKS